MTGELGIFGTPERLGIWAKLKGKMTGALFGSLMYGSFKVNISYIVVLGGK